MNALLKIDATDGLQTTARDLAGALLGKPRIAQDVRVVTSTYGSTGPRYVVLVTPAGICGTVADAEAARAELARVAS